MPIRPLIAPTIIVYDSRQKEVREVKKVLRDALKQGRGAEFVFEGFTEKNETLHYLESHPYCEVVLIVSDSIGVKPLKSGLVMEIKRRFSHAQAIIYSNSLDKTQIYDLQNPQRIIDRHVDKQEGRQTLCAACVQSVQEYYSDMTLDTVRHYLNHCDDPDRPLLAIGDKEYSPRELYLEMVKGSDIGREFLGEWRQLLKDIVVARAGAAGKTS